MLEMLLHKAVRAVFVIASGPADGTCVYGARLASRTGTSYLPRQCRGAFWG